MRTRPALVLLSAALLAVPALASADVKTQERTQVKFEGALGRMMNFFGGKAAREGIVNTVALKGNRLLTTTGDSGEIIDLGEEKVYTLDLKNKSYSVVTFAQMRQKMEEAMAKAKKDAEAAKPEPEKQDPSQPKKEFEVDFTITDGTGAKQIAGMDTKESIATITVREKGKKLEESGGFILETHLWMTPKVAALQELADFRMKYAQKVFGDMAAQMGANMTQAIAMYPQMKDAMAKLAEESKKLKGTPLLTESIFIAVASPEAQSAKADQKSEPAPGIGGLIGGLGRFGRGKKDQPAAGGGQPSAAAAAAPGRTTIMTTSSETLQITPAATDADVALPAGLKLK
ncbi:MAG: hypothetical protein U0P30_06660 [Vicinamibacterales bacterium]